ncbi:hypothetical protein [Rhodanobacter sp. MP7CTX1]|uniref:hypothetical protein n=1 Tax=Rhodanobacter sp. MP7CTX1 TaxID=2723084 RepID=UPI00160F5AFA|nr:hypothetical protein [Rhodanobacter sp. MP7CTX1]MBB6187563.1 hypothetical protein [Rhodanobacter sp. MP7CTX1]
MTLLLGYIIRAGVGESLLSGAQRVLAVSVPGDAVWLICLPRELAIEGVKKHHVLAPRRYRLSAISDAIEQGMLVMEDVPLPGIWQMTDTDYAQEAASESERKLRERRLQKRDARWNVIEPIVGTQRAQDIVPVVYLLRREIEAQAKAHHVSIPTIYSWIHRFWAGGSCLNSLLPNTNYCGNPGKRKKQSVRRLGRKSRLFKAGLIATEGYVLKSGDGERLACGYALVKPSLTVHDAYLHTMDAFWSTTNQNEHGYLRREMLPELQRPTQVQFEYWGRQLYGDPLRRQLMGSDRWATSTLAVAGSAQDQVHVIGQMGMIDSTSTDVYLTSVLSRLKVLPPMHRTIIVDVRSTMMVGFYLGWEDPSSATSLQAIFCAASDKREIAARFGIDLEDDEWPGMLHRLYLADNGEMKSAALMEAERQFRFGVEYVRAYSGQSKSQVENQHHTDHKALDHKLPGTTRGRQRKRGETPPSKLALWNYQEYMHEFILAALHHSKQEVPDRAPTDMKLAGVPPTRANVFRWLRDHHARADIPCSLDQLRAFTLPDRCAVIRREGIYLLMDDGIRQLSGHRYFTEALTRDVRWQKAAASHSVVKLTVKLDAQDLSHIWLPTAAGLLRIANVQAEQILLEGITLTDWVQHIEDEDLRKDQGRDARDQGDLDTLNRRGQTSRKAATEKRAEEAQLPKKPSRKNQATGLRQNKADEMAHMNPSVFHKTNETALHEGVSLSQEAAEAANRAMDTFHEGSER